jgi:hypothetical protein
VPERGEVCGKGTHVVEPAKSATWDSAPARPPRRASSPANAHDDDTVAVRVQAAGRGRAVPSLAR